MKQPVFRIFLTLFLSFSGPAWAALAIADLRATSEGSPVSGAVVLEDTPDGLKVTAHVENAAPGKHGFHFHENGSCADTGNAAGGHYNPDGVKHGDLTAEGFAAAHAGDLGNIEVKKDGAGDLQKVIPGLTIRGGKYNVENRAVVFHEKTDDFGQPTGNAGARIACGVVEATTP